MKMLNKTAHHRKLSLISRDRPAIWRMHAQLSTYEAVSKSFGTGRLERELQVVQLLATRCSCIAILWVSLVSFAAITLCVASQRMFIVVISLSTQSGNFRINPLTQAANRYHTSFNRHTNGSFDYSLFLQFLRFHMNMFTVNSFRLWRIRIWGF
jgi:hypothetical protein